MKTIKWPLRFQNKTTLTALIAAGFLLVQQVLAIFGITWDFSTLLTQVTGAVGTIFTLLSIIGVVVDPTTAGVADSTQALGYDAPKQKEEQ